MTTREPHPPLAELQGDIRRFCEERDWLKFHSPKNLSMAIAAEAAELMEHFLWCDAAQSAHRAADPSQRQAVADELADVMIYCLQFATATGIDPEQAIRRKMAVNRQRFPVNPPTGQDQ